MRKGIKAYMVCDPCGGYGEQIPSTPEEETKLLHALTSSRRPKIRCSSCGGSLELLTPEEFQNRVRDEMIDLNDPSVPWYEKQEYVYHEFKQKHGSPSVLWLLSLVGLLMTMLLARSCGK